MTNLALPVGTVFPGITVHANGFVYVHFEDDQGQVRVAKRTKDLDPGPAPNDVITAAANAGYQLVDADGFLYFAGRNAVYKVHPDTLAVSSTNSFQNLNHLNLLYDGRLIAADTSANLYIFERDFDTNPAHKSPVASYTSIDEANVNSIAVDALNKIYVITASKVWAIQWQDLNIPMVCLWRYSYSTSSNGSGTSVTVAADRVIFADRPLLAPFHYIAIPKNQNIPNCGAPTGACLQQAAASGTVDPRNSFNYGNDIAIVLGTGSQNG